MAIMSKKQRSLVRTWSGAPSRISREYRQSFMRRIRVATCLTPRAPPGDKEHGEVHRCPLFAGVPCLLALLGSLASVMARPRGGIKKDVSSSSEVNDSCRPLAAPWD
jgi:hypothetical protein